MTVKTLDSTVEGEQRLTSMRLESIGGAYAANVEGALVGALLTGNNNIPPAKRNLSEYPHLSSLVYEDHDAELDMIIGVAHIDTWVSSQVSRGATNQPLGINTIFGWTVVGACGRSDLTTITLSALATDNERLHQEIDKIFYNNFSIGTNFLKRIMRQLSS